MEQMMTEIIEGKEVPYVIVRSSSAGVFAGFLKKHKGKKVVLNNCTRIWKWDGAATISQLAITGPMRQQNCKFSMLTPTHIVLGVIEIIPTTKSAFTQIRNTPVWKE